MSSTRSSRGQVPRNVTSATCPARSDPALPVERGAAELAGGFAENRVGTLEHELHLEVGHRHRDDWAGRVALRELHRAAQIGRRRRGGDRETCTSAFNRPPSFVPAAKSPACSTSPKSRAPTTPTSTRPESGRARPGQAAVESDGAVAERRLELAQHDDESLSVTPPRRFFSPIAKPSMPISAPSKSTFATNERGAPRLLLWSPLPASGKTDALMVCCPSSATTATPHPTFPMLTSTLRSMRAARSCSTRWIPTWAAQRRRHRHPQQRALSRYGVRRPDAEGRG